MDQDKFIEMEKERAKRLVAFVKGELLNMYVDARFDFTADLCVYLTPEIELLLERHQLKLGN